MNPTKYSRQIEGLIKPLIAKELDLIPQPDSANIDYLAKDDRSGFELKLRLKYRNNSGEHFTPGKRQMELFIQNIINQPKLSVMLNDGKPYTPNIGYLLITYDLPFAIIDIPDVQIAMAKLKIIEAFLADRRFIIQYDTSKSSRWYNITEKTLHEHTRSTRISSLLGQTFPLHIVSEDRYLYKLAAKMTLE